MVKSWNSDMTILVLISILLTAAYIGFVTWGMGEVPSSMLAVVYGFEKKWSKSLWTAWLWIVAILVGVGLVSALPVYAKWLGFVTVCCLLGVGAAPFAKGETKHLHSVFAMLAGVNSQVCVALVCPWWLLVWALWLPLLAGAVAALNDAEEMPCLMDGYSVLVAELTCALSLYGSLLCVI